MNLRKQRISPHNTRVPPEGRVSRFGGRVRINLKLGRGHSPLRGLEGLVDQTGRSLPWQGLFLSLRKKETRETAKLFQGPRRRMPSEGTPAKKKENFFAEKVSNVGEASGSNPDESISCHLVANIVTNNSEGLSQNG